MIHCVLQERGTPWVVRVLQHQDALDICIPARFRAVRLCTRLASPKNALHLTFVCMASRRPRTCEIVCAVSSRWATSYQTPQPLDVAVVDTNVDALAL